jgi:hypothetical protein
MTNKLTKDMTPEEHARHLARSKRWRVNRQRGLPARMGPGAAREAIEHCQKLTAGGMSAHQISQISGAGWATTINLVKGYRGRDDNPQPIKDITRKIYTAVMAVQPIPTSTERSGCLVDATPTRRRIQALIADGYNRYFLADTIPMAWAQIRRISNGHTSLVMASTEERVKRAYGKLAGARPEDMGANYPLRARNEGRKKRWPPSHCWDWDTIDNPDAIPEWTGRCGTMAGYRLHVTHGIPVCPACRAAKGWK